MKPLHDLALVEAKGPHAAPSARFAHQGHTAGYVERFKMNVCRAAAEAWCTEAGDGFQMADRRKVGILQNLVKRRKCVRCIVMLAHEVEREREKTPQLAL